MLDLAFVRANLALVEEKLRARNMDPVAVLGDFEALDTERRHAISCVERLKAQRNASSQEFGKLKREGADTSDLSNRLASLKTETESLETQAVALDEKLRFILHSIPNLPDASVPVGKDEHANRIENVWHGGDKPPDYTPAAPSFTPLPHWELGERLRILDFERAAKISGSRFVVHYGQGARLERAIANFMLDLHTGQHGYTEVLPPYMVNSKSLFGTGQLPKFAADLFHCDDKPYTPGELQDSDHWLIPTAEVPVTNLYRDETLDDAQLTISLCAYTPCFRSEAGSYGKDVRGMIRQHQFQKVELVKFTRPQDSAAEHERLTRDAERVLEALGLPYRRTLLCTGDMGFSSAKTWDLEVWLPGQQLYREISSCSNFEAFQARRANIRYRPTGPVMGSMSGSASGPKAASFSGSASGPKTASISGSRSTPSRKSEFVHTLNGSGLAVGRTYLAILENYQQPDGTVRIPDALVPYMNGDTLITKRG